MKTIDVQSLARAVVSRMATLEASQMPVLAEAALEILRAHGRSRDSTRLPRLIRRMARRFGPLEAVIESASPLTETECSHLRSLIEQSSGHRVVLDLTENRSLIGGLRLRIGDDRFDYSIRSALNHAAKTFTSSR